MLHPRAKCYVIVFLIITSDGRRNLSDIDDNKTFPLFNVVIFCKVLSNPNDSAEFVIAILARRAAVQKGRRIKRNYAGNDVVAARNTLERKYKEHQ